MLTARRRTTAAERRGTNEESTRPSVVIVLRAALGTYLSRLMDTTMTNAGALLGVLPALVFFLVFQRTVPKY
jgi:ABC-type glycerol-3-phosphate transport system permease component